MVLKSRQLLNLEPATQQSHPRLSLRRVLYVKLLRWIDKSSSEALLKATRRAAMFLLVSLLCVAPGLTIGVLTWIAKWYGTKILILSVVLSVMLNAKRVWLALRRRRATSANQYTYHGLPVSEFASFLKTHESFKFEDATKKLALPERQYARIAKELDEAGITVKGPNNSRVLRPISLEQLVRQLKEGFPMMWDEIHNEWTDKEDAYGRYLRAEGFKTRRLTEDTQKAERKLGRIKKEIQTYKHPIFAQIAV